MERLTKKSMSDSVGAYRNLMYRLLLGSQGKAKRPVGLAGACRFVWNAILAHQNEAYKQTKEPGDQPSSVSSFSLGKRFTAFRRKFEWLPEHSFKVVRYPLKYQADAWMAFFKDGKGKPKPHSRHGSISFFTIPDKRWHYGVLPKGNANFAWVQHTVHHLTPKGVSGFRLANRSMSSNQSSEGGIRRSLIKWELVDRMVTPPGQLFYSTQIPVRLWFLARGRQCQGEILFTDTRKFCRMVDRTHRELINKDIARGIYRVWRTEECGYDADVAGLCRGTPLNEVRKHGHVLTSDGMWAWNHRRVTANHSRTR